MTRPALPSGAFPIIDAENNATVSFNEWEGFIDGQVIALGIGATGREPLPPGVIIMAAKPVIPYAKWLLWINRSVATFGTPTKRPPLPTSTVQLVGVDRKATIPFQMWLTYIDKLLG